MCFVSIPVIVLFRAKKMVRNVLIPFQSDRDVNFTSVGESTQRQPMCVGALVAACNYEFVCAPHFLGGKMYAAVLCCIGYAAP